MEDRITRTWMKHESLKMGGQEGLEKDMVVGSGEAIADQLKQYNYWCKWIAHCRYTRRQRLKFESLGLYFNISV